MLVDIFSWFEQYEIIFIWIGSISLVFFIAGILVLPWILSSIPADYFVNKFDKNYHQDSTVNHFIFRTIRIIIQNIIGIILIFLGFLMLFLPGPGILTIFAGVFIMDFPAKDKLELWFIKKPMVLNAINWLRKKNNHLPIIEPK